MNLTDEEIEILDTLICDANEVEFEDFTNNLAMLAIQCKEDEQEFIANHVTELFTDTFFVYALAQYAKAKEHVKSDIVQQFKNSKNKKYCIEETIANWYKTTVQIYENLIFDYLFHSGRV